MSHHLNAEYIPVSTIDEIFRQVEKGEVDRGVIPIENILEGELEAVFYNLVSYDVRICREVKIPVHHHLISKVPVEQIEKIYSHRRVFRQCQRWFDSQEKGRQFTLINEESTAVAVQHAVEEEKSAAIATKEAAQHYGLNIVCENIEDFPDVARFWVISKEYCTKTSKDKTTFLLDVAVGAVTLAEIFNVFANHNIKITMLQTLFCRTEKEATIYLFLLDCEGHISDYEMTEAYRELNVQRWCRSIRVVGSYPVDWRSI